MRHGQRRSCDRGAAEWSRLGRPVHGTPLSRISAASGGEGNARLAGLNGLLLVAVLALEGATILRIRQRARLVGVLLVGPVLLKCASTVYRFIRYYAAARAYRQKGPPQPMLAAAVDTWRDLRGSPTDPARSRRRVRIALTALAVVASIPAATAIMPEAALWTKETVGFRDR